MWEVSTPFNVVTGASGFAKDQAREQNLAQSAADLTGKEDRRIEAADS